MPVLRRGLLSPRGLLSLLAGSAVALPRLVALVRTARPDVVYVSTLTQPSWLLAGRLAGARVVCHVHEAEGSAGRLVRTALALPLLLAHRVLINSAFALSVVAGAVPGLGRRTVVVPNGVTGPVSPLAPVGPLRRPGGRHTRHRRAARLQVCQTTS